VKARQGTKEEGPTFCWHCNRQLHRAPGRGLGLFYFQLVRDRVGVDHRVHDACVKHATVDGDTTLVTHA
jgi:hypothetical protein